MPAPLEITLTDSDPFLTKPSSAAPPPAVRLLLCYEARYETFVDARVWLFLHSVGRESGVWEHEVWQHTGLTGGLDPASLPPGALVEPYAPFPTGSLRDRRGEEVRLGRACAFTGPAWSPDVAGPLARVLVRSRYPHESPGEVVHEGLITEAIWTGAADAFALELKANERAAEERVERAPSVIVETARTLGLRPEASKTSATSWRARCPETHHWIWIDAEREVWGCGYCQRKGAAEELRACAAERRTR